MLTNFLLCVLIAQLGYITGELAGKQPEMANRPWRGLITVISLMASLLLGAVLYFVLSFLAGSLEGVL